GARAQVRREGTEEIRGLKQINGRDTETAEKNQTHNKDKRKSNGKFRVRSESRVTAGPPAVFFLDAAAHHRPCLAEIPIRSLLGGLGVSAVQLVKEFLSTRSLPPAWRCRSTTPRSSAPLPAPRARGAARCSSRRDAPRSSAAAGCSRSPAGAPRRPHSPD